MDQQHIVVMGSYVADLAFRTEKLPQLLTLMSRQHSRVAAHLDRGKRPASTGALEHQPTLIIMSGEANSRHFCSALLSTRAGPF